MLYRGREKIVDDNIKVIMPCQEEIDLEIKFEVQKV